MIILKSNSEIELMRVAGKIVALTHEELKRHIKAGITTKELDKIAEEFILSQGATPSFKGLYGFPAATCISINEVLIHGIPDDRVLKDGDIISIDIGACYKGYHGDSAWSYAVGNVSERAKKILEVTETALFKGLEKANRVIGSEIFLLVLNNMSKNKVSSFLMITPDMVSVENYMRNHQY